MNLKQKEVWLLTGSQHLYGEDILKEVAVHSQTICKHFNEGNTIAVTIKFKAVVTTQEEILQVFLDANRDQACVGVMAWMHTFSPAKMWINGLKLLNKPLLHLHTQYGESIPWESIDMDYMNLHQSAHGDREFGFICTRMKISRKVVVGHWRSIEVQKEIDHWSRAACGWNDWQGAQFVRFGDNMRQVAVTEGDKVEAQLKFGFAVNSYGVGDLVEAINAVSNPEIDLLLETYASTYNLSEELKRDGSMHDSLIEAARIELGLKSFLEKGSFKGFTNTFEDLHGMKQLPGLPVQRLMNAGYGYAGEGDWKTMALVRAMKVMGTGLSGTNAFMEDYTYDFKEQGGLVLGAHMLEVDEGLAEGAIRCEIHPLGIGGKEDPVRLVFDGGAGSALNASLIDLGDKFRMVVNEVEAVKPPKSLPKLPVARTMWRPKPDFKSAATAWILSGGAHHTCFSQNLNMEVLEDFCEMAGIECVVIDEQTNLKSFKTYLKGFD
ncbi:L-arabinose isomerase [Cyclobacterium qasimii]|uniref:L-arabinose isomerase n=2 Tax=Cyclobacterium qasimii TaxID=1350429 RepID=S7VGF1_9BACT|nr:L-arabinose isomerase [Cyclobacterium qasimii]EPR69280.1 L-arabinose isomerase [Cyclobacterium qasimii M12-11B]GEO20941.1 L-arabinose isomerase [Cyclobacterium qasimii]